MSEKVGSVTFNPLTFMVEIDFNRILQLDGNLKTKPFSK